MGPQIKTIQANGGNRGYQQPRKNDFGGQQIRKEPNGC
jgi:hypothetical protein